MIIGLLNKKIGTPFSRDSMSLSNRIPVADLSPNRHDSIVGIHPTGGALPDRAGSHASVPLDLQQWGQKVQESILWQATRLCLQGCSSGDRNSNDATFRDVRLLDTIMFHHIAIKSCSV